MRPARSSASGRRQASSSNRISNQAQSGRRSHLRLLSLLRDRDLIGEARAEALALLDGDPELDGYPLLRDWVSALVDEERAEYLEKG